MCSFFTFEFSFQSDAVSSLGLAEVVGEEGALVGGEGVTAATVTRGTNTGAVGRSAALVVESLVFAGAVRTAGSSFGTTTASTGDREAVVG